MCARSWISTSAASCIRSPINAAAAVELARVALGQPVIFIVEYALAMWLRSLGVTPAIALGHSLGEYVAATVAGVFSFEDGLAIACERGRLMEQLPRGAMLIVPLAEAAVRAELGADMYISVVNAPEQTVISGHEGDIAALEQRLAAGGVQTRRFNAAAPRALAARRSDHRSVRRVRRPRAARRRASRSARRAPARARPRPS